mmetsp:Transcript_6793/g.28662  ORF Transcript_6793/g.28662 Transcript_6793/m.28662 type:complete len:247 (+) Transcript_6793:188-928(+)
MPSRRAVAATRQAISPRLAIRIFLNTAASRGELACVPGGAGHHAMCRWRDRACGASTSVGDQDLLEHLSGLRSCEPCEAAFMPSQGRWRGCERRARVSARLAFLQALALRLVVFIALAVGPAAGCAVLRARGPVALVQRMLLADVVEKAAARQGYSRDQQEEAAHLSACRPEPWPRRRTASARPRWSSACPGGPAARGPSRPAGCWWSAACRRRTSSWRRRGNRAPAWSRASPRGRHSGAPWRAAS